MDEVLFHVTQSLEALQVQELIIEFCLVYIYGFSQLLAMLGILLGCYLR
jgi:hypothetical protein